jgi:hypothetical protein
MKKLMGIIFILFSFISIVKSQNNQSNIPDIPIDDDTKLITYKEVVKEKGSKDEFFDRGFAWYHKFFKNPADVIKETNKEDGIIKGVARMQIYNEEKGVKSLKGVIEFTITTEFKDGRYRYTITNFNLKQASYFPLERWLNTKEDAYKGNVNKYLNQIDTYINDMIKNLVDAMEPVVKKKDNW